MTELKPWHQQPNETAKAFAAFNVYKNFDPSERSLQRVASELAKSKTIVSRWSFTWNWVERAEAWDEEEDRRLRFARIEYKKRMDEEHLKIARAGRNKAVQALAAVDPEDLSPRDVREWLDMCLRWERLIIGEYGTIEELQAEIAQRRARTAAAQDWDIEKEMEEIAPIIEDMYRRGILSDEDEEVA